MNFKQVRFWRDNILATSMVFGLVGFLAIMVNVKLFDAFNPIEDTFADMEVTDIVFSQIRPDPTPDTNIVLVNIGNLPRAGIARQLEIINKHQPLVVGLDVFFFERKDSVGDGYLADQIASTKNLVIVSRLEKDENGAYNKSHNSHPIFTENATIGFANLNTNASFQKDYKTCRIFPVRWTIDDNVEYPFSIEMARVISPEKVDRFLKRGNEMETINYLGNVADPYATSEFSSAFYAIDVEDLLAENFNPSIIKGKVVILGYLGDHLGDASWSDKFYTPLNKKYAGKTNPDMYGAVIHANIISMILQENFIYSISDHHGWGSLIAVIMCFLNITIFSYIHIKKKKYYDIITKSIQVVEVILLLYLSILFLNYFNLKLELTVTITCIILAGDLLEIYYNSFDFLRNKADQVTRWVRGKWFKAPKFLRRAKV